MTAIVDLRSKIRAVLGTAVDTSSWPDDLLDASVRQALPFLAEHLPPDEETIVCTAGCEQDLSALTDLYQIAAIGWPWNDDEGIFRHVPWRPLGKRQIYMEGGKPSAGDGLRLRYWKNITVAGLDGAAVSTVPSECVDLLVTGAAGYALFTRLRQIGENPAAPKTAQNGYAQIAGHFLARFSIGCQQLGALAPLTAWTAMGL
ncbi:MAG: hypothetical protein ACKO4U_13180 [Caldilinea sp.]|jgi:hypothetical protein